MAVAATIPSGKPAAEALKEPTAEEREKDSEATLRDNVEKVRAAAEKQGLQLPAAGDASLGSELGEELLAPLNASQRDWLLVFSSVCKLSAKEADAQGEKRQRVALELVLAMLQKCPVRFKTSESFVAVLRNTLCGSLVTNSVSQIPKISDMSLQIFFVLTKGFKEQLKPEIGIFIDEIVVRLLESGNSTYHHKFRALQVFYKLCSDSTSALELFINFDCNVDERNIFERMVDCLSKIAQGKYVDAEYTALIQPIQEHELRMLALRGLVALMDSLRAWLRKAGEAAPDGSGGDGSARHLEDGVVACETNGDAADVGANSQPPFTARQHSDGNLSVCEQKQRKRELQNGINKFNIKPKRGIEHLRHSGFVNEQPESMAELFRNGDLGLDKTAIGDFLGEDKPFNMSVLDALIAGLAFAGSELDSALRAFLALFRLPGEAQKISRMMEKFAEKYCQDNPGKFSNVDCAFVLSFSLIMLQTDLHNPGVKNKMTKDQFVNNNRGIDNGSNLPREYLESLYDSVAANPMSLKEDDEAKNKLESQAAQSVEARSKLFQKESKAIVSRSKDLMSQRSSKRSLTFVTARSPEHARPLFEVACWPMLATLSVLLETHDEQNTIDQCIEGFKHCTHISVLFDMQSQRDAIVSSLAKFTYLTTIKEIKQKNIDCLKALLTIGISEGNGLGPAWQYVLQCVSQLERLQIISEKARQDHQYFEADEAANAAKNAGKVDADKTMKRRAYANGVSALMTMSPEDVQIELVNSESVASQIDQTQLIHIFDRSERLDSSAIVHFVTQLARVSKEELALVDQPRIFALQKLVEVAMANMTTRPSDLWQRIWQVLSTHFIQVASHPNVRVGMYAIDSLRQLAKSFLENDQLCSSNLQVEFLRPFEVVMTKDKDKVSREVRELIVSSVSILVFTKIQNVRSGWKTVFSILYAAVHEPGNEAAPESAFSIMERVLDHNYEIFVDNFSQGIRALAAFASQANLDIALKATVYLQQAAACLVSDKTRPSPPPPPPPTKDDVEGHPVDAENPLVAHWFLILRALSGLVSDARPGVRGAGLTGVVHCLRDHGMVAFDEETWRMVFKGVIKPLFEDVHQQLKEGDATLVKVVTEVVLRGVKDLSKKNFARCMPEIFPLLSKLVSVSSPEVRLAVQDILLEQVQPLIIPQAPAAAEANGR